MTAQIMDSLKGFVPFIAYFGGGVALLILFSLVYSLVTPYSEYKLLRQGKTAPAISFGGAMLGFTCPLFAAIFHSANFLDMVLWALIALIIQILVFVVLRLLFSHLIKDISEDKKGPAIFLAFVSISIGVINAASMTY